MEFLTPSSIGQSYSSPDSVIPGTKDGDPLKQIFTKGQGYKWKMELLLTDLKWADREKISRKIANLSKKIEACHVEFKELRSTIARQIQKTRIRYSARGRGYSKPVQRSSMQKYREVMSQMDYQKAMKSIPVVKTISKPKFMKKEIRPVRRLFTETRKL